MTKYEKDQIKLKRWFEKKLPWVYMNICSQCGIEFYTHDDEQTVCECCQKAGRSEKSTDKRENNA